MIKLLAVGAFFSMLFCGLMLPSDGNHGIFSAKSLTFLAAAGGWLLYAIAQRRYNVPQLSVVAGGAVVSACLLLWMCLGVFYGETPFGSQFDQFKVFIITLTALVMALFYIYAGVISPQGLLVGAIYANFAYSSLKVMAGVLHMLGIIDILSFMKLTGFRLMSMDIHGGMVRLQTSVDVATPFILFFVLQRRALGLSLPRGFPTLYCAVTFVSVLLSFSRYLMFVSALALFFHWLTLTPWRQVWAGVTAVLFLSAVTAFVGGDTVYKVVEKRLFSVDNYYSDRTRFEQIAALEEETAAYPLLGKGIGASAPRCIRDSQLTYSYEVQWVAFSMQLGILGTFLLVVGFVLIGWRYLLPPYTCSKLAFGALYFLWLLSGFTNPFLISLTSGIIYALFSAAALCLSSQDRVAFPRKPNRETLEAHEEAMRGKGVDCESLEKFWKQMKVEPR